jgi:6-phosphogluconolactonase
VLNVRTVLPVILLLSSAFVTGQGKPAGDVLVYFGTYTNAKSKGIYVSRLDMASGALSRPQLAAETPSPSFLALRPKGDFLYAVNEVDTFGGKRSGSVSAFSIDRASGKLTALNQESSEGAGPAHLEVDHSGRNVLVANYGGGSIAVLPIAADGRLKPASSTVQHTGSSVNPDRQKSPHAHAITVDSTNHFAYVADLGLDKVMIYRFDADRGTLTANDPPSASVEPGAGPRHFAIHPSGRFAYVINEIACTVTAFTRDPKNGALTTMQTITTLPSGQSVQKGYSTAEIMVHPSGKFLYGSNRGHDSIVAFAIDPKSGRLTYIEHQPTQGSTPRGFGIDPTGKFLIAGNQRSDSVVVFRIDAASGRLTAAGQPIEVGAPVSVVFVR